MFPPGVNSKKRGCAFENPEPSSPKVTCIGQVRVKTKKQGKKMKMAYKARRITTTSTINERTHELKEGESKNQSWVQFPVTICDAFSCFIPCKSGEGNKGEKRETSSSSSSCYRWFVAFNEGGGGEGKTGDIELVVGEEEGRMEEERVVMEREVSRRRSIFDDMDFNVDEICNGGGGGNEGSRASVCVPPKNALLLMRCRSDPVKMSALVNKFLESPTKEDEEVVEEEIEEKRSSVREDEKIEAFSICDEVRVREEVEDEKKIESLSNSDGVGDDQKLPEGEEDEEKEENGESTAEDVDQKRVSVSVSEDGFMNLAMLFEEEEDPDEMEKEEATDFGQTPVPPESTPPIEHFQEEEEDLVEIQATVIGKDSIFEYNEEEDNNQPPPLESQEEEEKRVVENQSRSEEQSPIEEEEEEEEEKQFKAMEKPVLPDCLLLMMCEPKLSMEVSQETWVCSTDFLRPWLPERHRQHQLKKLTGAGDEPNNKKKKKKSKKNRGGNTDSHPPLPPAAAPFQPPRSSCSFPISMASLIEKKLVSAVAYEPFVLTRCKSEPMRTASAKLGAPQEVACFWKNSKIEPHRPATCGIGATEVGF